MMISEERVCKIYNHLLFPTKAHSVTVEDAWEVVSIIDRLRVAERALDLITGEYKAEVIGLEVDYWKQRAESELRAEGVIAEAQRDNDKGDGKQ